MNQASTTVVIDLEIPTAVSSYTPPTDLSTGDINSLIETWLERLLPSADTQPQTLHRAMRYAVFSGGKRLRPQLLLRTVYACSTQPTALAVRAACAIELIHTASLIHDDLPCFDDAAERRGRPALHIVFGEPMAVLVGDALLALAFEILADVSPQMAPQALRLLRLLGKMTGSRSGIIGGQSLEQSDMAGIAGFSPELIERYHQMKTATLFQMATEAAALAAGIEDSAPWATVGRLIGRFHQLADDWIDVYGQAVAAGKPIGQDAARCRPNIVHTRGAADVAAQIRTLHAEIRVLVTRLAVFPWRLLEFLDTLDAHLLRAVGIPSTELLSASPE